MKNSTLHNEEVNKMLESRFYFIPFDGEQKEAVTVKGQTFNYIPNGKKNGVHELANQLGTIDGKLIYPVTTILNPKGEISFQYSGYLPKKAFMAVLKEAQ
jgi:thioredoxin-related protein